MALPFDRQIEHLLRRAGYGARNDEIDEQWLLDGRTTEALSLTVVGGASMSEGSNNRDKS